MIIRRFAFVALALVTVFPLVGEEPDKQPTLQLRTADGRIYCLGDAKVPVLTLSSDSPLYLSSVRPDSEKPFFGAAPPETFERPLPKPFVGTKPAPLRAGVVRPYFGVPGSGAPKTDLTTPQLPPYLNGSRNP